MVLYYVNERRETADGPGGQVAVFARSLLMEAIEELEKEED